MNDIDQHLKPQSDLLAFHHRLYAKCQSNLHLPQLKLKSLYKTDSVSEPVHIKTGTVTFS